ncbi:MAG: hypothetical protein C5B51_16530 [Terriglobia bacterium]|nr:MAG: hypothetical protein C5B51_16530 [Terriglobia bacterium]
MKKIIAVAAALLLLPAARAHHSFSATYDSERQLRLKGTVTRIDWVNPHAYLFVNVTDPNGTMTNWAVEFGNPLELERDGWKRTSLRIGDVVAVEGVPARGDRKEAFAKSVVLDRTGQKLFVASAKPRAAAARQPAPRWPDGQIRLGPPPGKKGYWGAASASALVENAGSPIAMDRDGLLKNLADAARVAPFLPWARALYEYRQRTLLKDDPFARCLPPGGPRQFQTANGFQFIEQRELGRILVLLGGGDRNWRAIYTDGRSQGQADEVVRTYYGNSVGHWEKDTLVVDSIGFNERFWMSNGGLPHTEALHLVERFSRPDFNTLKYEVTVDDPRTYTRPWMGGWTIQWVPDEEIQEYFCEENAETTFVR